MTAVSEYWAKAGERRLSRRAMLRAGTAGAGIAGLAAVGCGSAGKTAGGAAKPTSGPAASSDSGLKPGSFKTGGTLQVQLNSVGPLDPYYNSSFITVRPASCSYSRLLRFVASTDPSVFTSHQVAPDLVES